MELEVEDWRMVARERGQWRRVIHRVAETPSPLNQENMRKRAILINFPFLININPGAVIKKWNPFNYESRVKVNNSLEYVLETNLYCSFKNAI